MSGITPAIDAFFARIFAARASSSVSAAVFSAASTSSRLSFVSARALRQGFDSFGPKRNESSTATKYRATSGSPSITCEYTSVLGVSTAARMNAMTVKYRENARSWRHVTSPMSDRKNTNSGSRNTTPNARSICEVKLRYSSIMSVGSTVTAVFDTCPLNPRNHA